MHFYLNHRLVVAGYQGGRLFSQGALRQLRRASKGVPRLVNILAHKSLLAAYGKGSKVVEGADVRAASQDTGATRKRHWIVWAVAGVAAFAVAAVAVLVWSRMVTIK